VGVGIGVGAGGDGGVGSEVGVGAGGGGGVGSMVGAGAAGSEVGVVELVRGVALPPQASNKANTVSTQRLANARLVLLTF
jgi:hypothetical protein